VRGHGFPLRCGLPPWMEIPLDSSARNRFRGRVTRIAEDGRGGVTLHVDVGIDLVVRITRGSLNELGIELGTEVYLSIKAMAVQVF